MWLEQKEQKASCEDDIESIQQNSSHKGDGESIEMDFVGSNKGDSASLFDNPFGKFPSLDDFDNAGMALLLAWWQSNDIDNVCHNPCFPSVEHVE